MSRLRPGACLLGLLAAACGGDHRAADEARPVTFGDPRPEPAILETDAVGLFPGDFDGDPRWQELLVVYGRDPWAEILENTLTNNFRSTDREIDLQALAPAERLRPVQAEFRDFTGDDIPDLALLNGPDAHLIVLRGDGRGGFTLLRVIIPPESEAARIHAFSSGFYNGDQLPDFIFAAGSGVLFAYSDSSGSWSMSPRNTAMPDGVDLILGGDVQRRGADEIVAIGPQGVHLVRLNNSGVFIVDEERHAPVTDAQSAVMQDVNTDMFLDLLFTNSARNAVTIYLTNVDRDWVANDPEEIEVPSPTAIALLDMTNDGLLDLLVASSAAAGETARVHILPQLAEE